MNVVQVVMCDPTGDSLNVCEGLASGFGNVRITYTAYIPNPKHMYRYT